MQASIQDSIVVITSRDQNNSRFGTGFVVHHDDEYTYLLTCAHVVRDVGGEEQVLVNERPATVLASGTDIRLDLAVLRVKGLNHRPTLPLRATGRQSSPFVTAGYKHFSAEAHLIRSLEGNLVRQSGLRFRGQRSQIKTWDLKITGEDKLQPGYSGSPVIDKENHHVIGVVSHQEQAGKRGLAISIAALEKIWPEKARELLYPQMPKAALPPPIRPVPPVRPAPPIRPVPPIRPAPPYFYIILLVSSLLVLFLSWWMTFSWFQNANFLFAVKMSLLAFLISIIPTIAYHSVKRWGRIARIAVETILFVILIMGFTTWLFGLTVFGIWIVFAVGLILLLEVGSHIVERYQIVTLRRLSDNERLGDIRLENMRDEVTAVKKMVHSELALYIPIPIGLILGAVIGLTIGYSQLEIVNFSLQLILWTVSIALVFFLIVAFKRMINPLFDTLQSVTSPEIAEKEVNKDNLFKKLTGTMVKLFIPPPKPKSSDQKQKFLDVAYLVTDLRKIYLYDAVHNVALLVACVAVAANLRNIVFSATWVVGGLIALSIVFNQWPFVYGQWRLQEKILEYYEGTEREELRRSLEKYAPLFPKSNLWASLFTYGMGGLAFYFLDRFIKSIFG